MSAAEEERKHTNAKTLKQMKCYSPHNHYKHDDLKKKEISWGFKHRSAAPLASALIIPLCCTARASVLCTTYEVKMKSL
jgi:hypothetical protein